MSFLKSIELRVRPTIGPTYRCSKGQTVSTIEGRISEADFNNVMKLEDVVEAAKDLVSLWKLYKINGATRVERNEAIEESRARLIAAVEKVP